MSCAPRRNLHRSLAFLCISISSPNLGIALQSVSPIAEKVHQILVTNCVSCHRDGGEAFFFNVEQYANIMARKQDVVPLDAANSRLFQKVNTGNMPKGGPKLHEEDISTLRQWIEQGAPSWEIPSHETPRTFVSEAQILQLILSDLNKQSERSRTYLRYYSLVHLYNAGVSGEILEQYRIGLSKLVNSLSRFPEIVKPFPINPEGTLLRIDLRKFTWDDSTWKTILHAYPYGISSSGSDEIRRITGTDVPYVRADWFVYQASTIPLYHQILRLPSTIKELETQQGVDVAKDFRDDNVFRAGFSVSGVSRHNRIIERHYSTTSNGAYWRSYDFRDSEGENNILRNPLTFNAAGGEIIFNLPNGLQAYMLADAEGKRLDGPADQKIVHDDEGGIDNVVTNGRSCMACHFKGMRDKPDEVRSTVFKSPRFPDREKVIAVYPPQDVLKDLFKKDDARFEQAILAAGGRTATQTSNEPVNMLSKKYAQPLTLELAAAELGLQTSAFRQKIDENQTLGNLGFRVLLEGGAYQRDTFESNFPEVARELGLGVPMSHTLVRDSNQVSTLAQSPPEAPVHKPEPTTFRLSQEARNLRDAMIQVCQLGLSGTFDDQITSSSTEGALKSETMYEATILLPGTDYCGVTQTRRSTHIYSEYWCLYQGSIYQKVRAAFPDWKQRKLSEDPLEIQFFDPSTVNNGRLGLRFTIKGNNSDTIEFTDYK